MDWIMAEDRQYPDHWRVEAVNHEGDGEIYVAVFSGPGARERAQEYAAWRSGAVGGAPR